VIRCQAAGAHPHHPLWPQFGSHQVRDYDTRAPLAYERSKAHYSREACTLFSLVSTFASQLLRRRHKTNERTPKHQRARNRTVTSTVLSRIFEPVSCLIQEIQYGTRRIHTVHSRRPVLCRSNRRPDLERRVALGQLQRHL
jgi:hypothetical protein